MENILRQKQCSRDQQSGLPEPKGQKNQLKKRFGVIDAENPILHLCIDAPVSVCKGIGNITLSPLPLIRSTPSEALHCLLQELYKYLFRFKMKKLSTNEKEELRARISAFSFRCTLFKGHDEILQVFCCARL